MVAPDQIPFQMAAAARVLTPIDQGVKTLLECLERGEAFRASPIDGVQPMASRGDGPWVFCESSGTTGAAKVIKRRPTSWRASFEINRETFDIGPEDVYAVLGHLGHSLTVYAALEALHLGCGLAVLGGQSPVRQADALRGFGVTILYATPSQLRMLFDSKGAHFPQLRHVICGGGRLDEALKRRMMDHCPAAQVTEFFGASETSFITMSDAQTPQGSVGKAYPGVTLRIGDGQTPKTSQFSEISGEIWVKSPYLFAGYAVVDSPSTRWQGDFLCIGEIGRLCADGYLYLLGRRDRMVTVSDQNVFPEAIEAVLLQQAGIEAAAVLSIPDPRRGHRILAVILGQGDQRADNGALRRACRQALGDAATPKDIKQVAVMPMLAAGKPDLQALYRLWQEGAL